MTTLDALRPGQRGRILEVGGEPGLVQRLLEFGFLDGEVVELVAIAPLGDPVEVRVGNTRLSLRRREAAGVRVELLV
jgi:ferrous iron transport protein A